MRCFASLVFAAVAGAEESLFDDSSIQLLQLKANVKEKEADVLNDMILSPITEAQSMQNAECAISGRVALTKTFYGFTNWLMWLMVKDTNGADKMVMDIKNNGLFTMATSKDERFTVQTYTSGPNNNANEIHAIAFGVDGTAIRVLPPEPETYQKCAWPTRSAMCYVWPYDDNAVLKTWANHKMRIRIGDKEYSQADMPFTVPGTNIEITQHKWNMNAQVHLQSGLIIDNKDGFRAQLEIVSSNGNGLWMNVNVKFAPDNIPERYQDSFCGRGPEASPIGGPEQDLNDYGGDWDQSLFTADDQHDICYADTRFYGVPAANFADPPWCPSMRETKWVGGDRMARMWRGGWGEPEGYGPDGEGQCMMTDELKEEAWKKIEAYAQNMIANWDYSFCSKPKREPTPTTQQMCTKNHCDHSIGEGICEPLKVGEEGGMYHDCLFEFCAECQKEAAEEFVQEIDPEQEGDDEDDEAGAVGDPHLSPAGGKKFDLDQTMLHHRH